MKLEKTEIESKRPFQVRPGAAWLTVNRKCNFRCKWCYAKGSGYSAKREMSLDLAEDLANISQQIGVHNLLLIGGEPTLWKPLIEFNEFCMQKKILTILITNGMRFGVDKFWQKYVQYPNNRIALSLKASTPQQFYQVAGVGGFEIVKKGLTRAIQELDAQISITYNTFYVDTLKDMVQFAMDCGAKSIKIDFCSTTFVNGEPNATYMVKPQEVAQNIMRDYPELERITKGRIVFEMMVPFCLWPLEFINQLKQKGQLMSVCHLLKRKGIIFDEFGNIIMCNALFDYPLGRYGKEFYDGESLLAWLDTDQIISYYNRIGCYPSEACKTCSLYSECGGGCPLRWALYKPDEFVRPV